MELHRIRQAQPIADPVSAKIAIIRPILVSVLRSISGEVVEGSGYSQASKSRAAIPLHMLSRLRSQGDGDTGNAFEFAIHEAVNLQDPRVMERITDALKLCRIRRGSPESIFFAIERAGAEDLIETRAELITEESVVLAGDGIRPIKLRPHLETLASAFRRQQVREQLPQSIRGLWKADLFLGSADHDHWVGTSVKIQSAALEGAAGLRIGIVPAKSLNRDVVRKDDQRNLIVCPILHDGSYMQAFYETWRIVQVLLNHNFKMPAEVHLPDPEDREVARVFVERRKFALAEVLDATKVFAQPYLLDTNEIEIDRESLGGQPATSTLIVPYARDVESPAAQDQRGRQ
jgi:hypothetical protein